MSVLADLCAATPFFSNRALPESHLYCFLLLHTRKMYLKMWIFESILALNVKVQSFLQRDGFGVLSSELPTLCQYVDSTIIDLFPAPFCMSAAIKAQDCAVCKLTRAL